MIVKENKNELRKKRHFRVRSRVEGSAARPRLNVFRSTSHIYAQIIDDEKEITLTSSSTVAKDINIAGLNKSDAAREVGKSIAKKALELGIKAVVFDRGGYVYTGRVRALADGAREAGLEF